MTNPQELIWPPVKPDFRLLAVHSARELAETLHGWRDARLVVRTVRGAKMRNVAQLHNEFAAVMQFPSYYGENWDAFHDCLTDLVWLPSEAGYVLLLTDAHLALDTSPSDLEILVRLLASAIAEWAAPAEAGEWWDRPAVAFNVVLACDPAVIDSARERWNRAGAVLTELR